MRLAQVTAGVVVAVAVLSGCSATEPANETLPAPSATSTAASETLPPLGPANFPVPAEAREKTPEGALAFGRYYMTLGDHIGNTDLDATPLLELSRDCSLCQQIARSFEQDRAAGYSYSHSSFTFNEYGLPTVTDDRAELGFVYSQSPYSVVDRSGKLVPARSGQATGQLQSGMLLRWDSALRTWLVTSLTVG